MPANDHMSEMEDIPPKPAETGRGRVMHVIEATLGGTLRFVKDAVEVLPTTRFDLALAYATARADPGLGPVLEEAKAKGWQLFPVEMVRAISPRHDLQAIQQLRRVIQAFRPQVLHCHSSKAGAIGRIAARLSPLRPRVVYTPNALAASMGARYLMLEKLLARITDCYGAVSESERKEFEQYGLLKHGGVTILDPLVDTELYVPQDRAAARLLLGIPDRAHVMVGVGRLTEQKDPVTFVEIVRQARALSADVMGVWVGDGELRGAVEAAIGRAGLADSFVLSGWQRDVKPWLAASDVLLSTSKYESFGYMVAEALSMERPVVATSVTGTSDIMSDDLRDFLYPVGDTGRAATLVTSLFENATLAAAIGRSGRASIERRFSRAIMGRGLTDCYTSLGAHHV